MDIAPQSKWYIISAKWLTNWRDYIAYKTTEPSERGSQSEQMEIPHPGMILNEDILDNEPYLIEDQYKPHLNLNLKENLREEDNYHIVNEKVWNFLAIRYGGVEIIRFGVQRQDSEE